MHRMGLRRGGLLVLGMMGLALVLGGCSNNKKADLAQTEAAELREKIAQLEEANRQKDAQLASQQQQPATDTGNWGGETGTTTRTSGGNGRSFTENEQGRPQAVIAGDVLFASGSADIKADARKTLDKIAGEIKRDYAGATIRVDGYTDSDPIKRSKWGTNERLSQARADAVKNYFASKGISSSRIETMGWGSAKPKASKAQSRRVEIVIQ